jgi:hypothetical protein
MVETGLHTASRRCLSALWYDREEAARVKAMVWALGAGAAMERDARGRTPAEAWYRRRARFGDPSLAYETLVDAEAEVRFDAAQPGLSARLEGNADVLELILLHLRGRATSVARVDATLAAEQIHHHVRGPLYQAVATRRACFVLARFRVAERFGSRPWQPWLLCVPMDSSASAVVSSFKKSLSTRFAARLQATTTTATNDEAKEAVLIVNDDAQA